LTLPNRGVLFGVTTPEQMLRMAEIADQSGAFQSIWVGDSLLGKPRMESVALLAGLAARTKHVRLGPACMASITLRDPVLLAYQWASLDLLAEGRTVLVACTGIIPQEGGRIEGELYGLSPRDRVGRMVEWIELIKRLWTEDQVSFQGQYYKCEGITIEPKPAAKPRPPIWIANNATGKRATIERTHQRVVDHAEGWETSLWNAEDLRWRLADINARAEAAGRDPAAIEKHLYHNININDHSQADAVDESKRFLDLYYTANYPTEFVAGWTATGSVDQIVEHLLVYKELGFDEATLRITSWNQFEQLQRVIEEVIPRVVGAEAPAAVR
jgi:alkanesulfonate monooxygenase SsuD/methylene tetrahydromethanopterin reductase-like flavin-dependent oxidoreductase (luciferase family)